MTGRGDGGDLATLASISLHTTDLTRSLQILRIDSKPAPAPCPLALSSFSINLLNLWLYSR